LFIVKQVLLEYLSCLKRKKEEKKKKKYQIGICERRARRKAVLT